jgi:hypothetical protein
MKVLLIQELLRIISLEYFVPFKKAENTYYSQFMTKNLKTTNFKSETFYVKNCKFKHKRRSSFLSFSDCIFTAV